MICHEEQNRNSNSHELKEFLASIEVNLREKSEPAFRRLVSDYLGKEYRTVDEKILAIKTKERWQWLGKLYPAVFTRDRQGFDCSVLNICRTFYLKYPTICEAVSHRLQGIGLPEHIVAEIEQKDFFMN